MTPERVGISEASLIAGVTPRKMRDLGQVIPGAAKIEGVWQFDEQLLRDWIAGLVESNISEARRKALSGRFPCSIYMGTMRTWLREPNRLYFIQAGDAHIKIGVTFNTKARIDKLQCGNPFKLNLLAEIDGNRQREMYLHEFYAAERVRGEWFEPSERLLAYIEKLQG